MLCATKMRLAETHVWPAATNAPKATPLTASSRSTSSKTKTGALPPSSAQKLAARPPTRAPIFEPATSPPVKSILATSRCAASAAAATWPWPGTTLTTPGGAPASFKIAARASTEMGAISGGLMTTVFPVASATATFFVAMSRGWFHGVTTPQTPRGLRATIAMCDASPPKGGMASSRVSATAAWYSNHSGSLANCARNSAIGRPVQSVSIGASAGSAARRPTAARRSTAARCFAPASRHAGNANLLDATAAATSASLAASTVVTFSSV
mmetsp:Transcript_12781/g.44183  ORF Transcript_12781/g.44183 Transcript_12781/m.44183 type:complete len:269 (-) Transcript_12781:206-1012(-)